MEPEPVTCEGIIMGDGNICLGYFFPNIRPDGSLCEDTDTILPMAHFGSICDPTYIDGQL